MAVKTSDSTIAIHDPITRAELGTITTRTYLGEGVLKHTFNNGTRQFSLGPSTLDFEFVDWPEIFDPLFSEGYEVAQMIMARGGLKIHAVLQKPDGPTYKDPLSWDTSIWGKSNGLKESIVINAGMKPGFGYHFSKGFFRMICTNGLVVPSLMLGSGDYNHRTFSTDKLLEDLFGKSVVVVGDQILGETIGKKSSLTRVSNIISTLREAEDLEAVPPFMRKIVSPVVGLTEEVRSAAVEQFEQLINVRREDIFELDIANVVTSAMNRPEKVAQRNFFEQSRLQRSLSDLVGAFSL